MQAMLNIALEIPTQIAVFEKITHTHMWWHRNAKKWYGPNWVLKELMHDSDLR